MKTQTIYLATTLLICSNLTYTECQSGNGDIVVEDTTGARIEVFTFMSNGTPMKGKVHLPASYPDHKTLPAVYLIDFTEQHFELATDEFEKVIDGIDHLDGIDALVVSLDGIPDIDAVPEDFQAHFSIFKDLAVYIDSHYTTNPSRTFIGRGSESGVVLMAMFLSDTKNPVFSRFVVTDPSPKYATALIGLIEDGELPLHKQGTRLHLSFSASNDRNKCTKLIRSIQEANYSWLRFESKEYSDRHYENTYPVAYAEGLEYVFRDE